MPRVPLLGVVVGLLLPAVFIGIGFGVPTAPLLFGIIGIAVLLAVV